MTVSQKLLPPVIQQVKTLKRWLKKSMKSRNSGRLETIQSMHVTDSCCSRKDQTFLKHCSWVIRGKSVIC